MSNINTDTEQMKKLVIFIDTVRSLDFFQAYSDLSTSDLIVKLNDVYKEDNFSDIEFDSKYMEIVILRMDKSRVWWNDLEADVCSGNDVYTWVLPSLAQISRGTLDISDVKEIWESDEGPINVTFKNKSVPCTITPNYSSDWIDLLILNDLNILLNSTDYRFEIFEPDDQMVEIILLTKDEKQKLVQLQEWVFADY